MQNKITVIGSSNTDMILKTKRIPKPGETILGDKFTMAAGGKGANQAVAAARSGGDVTFICKVGEDVFGEEAIKGFQKDKINVDYIFKDKETASGIALIFVDDNGENSIGVGLGANANLSVADIEKCKYVIVSSSILLIQLETPVETVKAAAKIAFENNVTVILNPAPAQQLDDELLSYVSIITPNETEAELLTGIQNNNEDNYKKAATFLKGKGIEKILLTLGSKGVFVSTEQEEKIIPAFKVEAKDTTAAGDVFNGALAVALSENKSIEESVKFANAAAALSVKKFGAQPSIPYRIEVEELLNSVYNN